MLGAYLGDGQEGAAAARMFFAIGARVRDGPRLTTGLLARLVGRVRLLDHVDLADATQFSDSQRALVVCLRGFAICDSDGLALGPLRDGAADGGLELGAFGVGRARILH